jgi:hypothetical protein
MYLLLGYFGLNQKILANYSESAVISRSDNAKQGCEGLTLGQMLAKSMSQPQPLLDFLHTLPPFIAKAPPVIGVSEYAFAKVVLQLDRQLTNVSIDPRLLKSPCEVRAQVLEAIHDAQEFRDRQVRAIISEHSQVAKLSIWDVEGTLLAVRNQQSEALRSVKGTGTGCNRLVSVVRSQQNQIIGLVLNSTNLCCRQELERSILHAAQQGYEEIHSLQKILPFPRLITI